MMNFPLNHFLCVLLLLNLFGFSALAQERYVDEIFTDVTMQTFSYTEKLALDFYQAKDDSFYSKPLLLLVHGGGFSGGKRDNPLEKKFSEVMAKKGFAVASMSYRLLRKGKGFNCQTPAQEKIETFAWAADDVLQATSYILENSVSLGVDPQKIILVGSSAGAEAILHAAFMQKLPEFQNPMYAHIRYAGLISFAGAMLNVDYISKENAVPSLFFHGKKDNLVPYKTASHHYCDKNAPGYLVLDGSKTIAKRLRYFDIAETVAVDARGNHDWANLAFAQISIITRFINEAILKDLNQKSKIKLRRK
jgi:poly(3-hydroxybutyrate) depolymerase